VFHANVVRIPFEVLVQSRVNVGMPVAGDELQAFAQRFAG